MFTLQESPDLQKKASSDRPYFVDTPRLIGLYNPSDKDGLYILRVSKTSLQIHPRFWLMRYVVHVTWS